jgi:hypothetical protein
LSEHVNNIMVCLMQRGVINNRVAINLVSGLLLTVASSAFADDGIWQSQPYSVQLAGDASNPWALPPEPELQLQPKFRSRPQDRYYQYQDDQKTGHDEVKPDYVRPSQVKPGRITPGMGSRFVTPEILESIKQQQMKQQEVPVYSPYSRSPGANYSHRIVPQQLMSEPPSSDYYGNTQSYDLSPQSGMGYANPLYDVPAVSPWGNGADLLYRGEEFPWLPSAALGGIPPIPISPYFGSNGDVYTGETIPPVESTLTPKQDQVFNPFTFAPNGNW